MADTFSKEERSEIMRRVKSKDTSLERRLRSALHRRGLRFRLDYPLPGKPDIVFVAARLAVFVDSCFWHGCSQHLRMPNSNRDYWERKIGRNIERDMQNNAAYAGLDWKLLRIWEHSLTQDFDECVEEIAEAVCSHRSNFAAAT